MNQQSNLSRRKNHGFWQRNSARIVALVVVLSLATCGILLVSNSIRNKNLPTREYSKKESVSQYIDFLRDIQEGNWGDSKK